MPTTKTWPLTVLLLAAATTVAVRSEEDTFDRLVNGTRLAAVAFDFRRHLSTTVTARGDGSVVMRLRPADEDGDGPACGYKFTASTAADGRADGRDLPAPAAVRCDGRDEYRVHVANRTAAEYDATASLGRGARVDTVRLETAGAEAVPLADLCFGFIDDGGTARAFCADVGLLDACRRRTGMSSDLDFGTARLRLAAERPYSCREIVFREVDRLVGGFEALVANTADADARSAVCERIGFVGSESRRLEGCIGRSVADGPSPDRQFVFTGRGRLVDVGYEYDRCERFNAIDVAAPAGHGGDGNHASGGHQTSGGRTVNPLHGFLFLLNVSVLFSIRAVMV